MKLSIEKSVFGCLTLSLIIYAFREFAASPDVILYRLSELWVFLSAFFFMAFRWTGDPEKKWNGKKRWSLMIFFWVFSWFLISLMKIVMDLIPQNAPILFSYFFLPHVADIFLEPMIPGLIAGILYGTIRYTILSRDMKKLKIMSGIVGAVLFVYGAIFVWNMSYSGSDRILFLDRDQQFETLDEVLSQHELSGKAVYVDLWFSSCSPCITAFQNMDAGKELLDQENVVVLYLGREISVPDSKSRWLRTIRDYKLEGYHVYMSETLEQDVARIVKTNADQHLAYPHYLLIDETGTVTDWDAPGIMEVELLSHSISKLASFKTSK